MGPGSGGEYDVQAGFGWTNGVAISLLAKYGDRISPEDWTSGAAAATGWLYLALAAIVSATFLHWSHRIRLC